MSAATRSSQAPSAFGSSQRRLHSRPEQVFFEDDYRFENSCSSTHSSADRSGWGHRLAPGYVGCAYVAIVRGIILRIRG